MNISIHDMIQDVERIPWQAARDAECLDLAGEPGDAYRDAQKQIGRLIETARRAAREIKGLRAHRHDWNESDYCSICGADGRA